MTRYIARYTGECRIHAKRAPWFTVELKQGDFDISITSGQPRSDLAREMVRQGASPQDYLEVWDGEKLVWKPVRIAFIANYEVEDSPAKGISRRRSRERVYFWR